MDTHYEVTRRMFPVLLKSGGPLWPWQKCRPRPSLVKVGQAATARPWILNLIQISHWLSVFSTLWVGWIVLDHLGSIEERLGTLSQAYGLQLSMLLPGLVGLCPILMHVCEGWQVVPQRGTVDPDEGHDPVLRRVACRFLFSGLTWGQLLLSWAVFGSGSRLLPLWVVLALVVLLGPAAPLLPWSRRGALLLPVPVPLALAFSLSLLLAFVSVWHLLASPLAAEGWPSALAVAPLICFGLGGALEGGLAETSFNQWWHLAAALALTSGFVVYGVLISIVFA